MQSRNRVILLGHAISKKEWWKSIPGAEGKVKSRFPFHFAYAPHSVMVCERCLHFTFLCQSSSSKVINGSAAKNARKENVCTELAGCFRVILIELWCLHCGMKGATFIIYSNIHKANDIIFKFLIFSLFEKNLKCIATKQEREKQGKVVEFIRTEQNNSQKQRDNILIKPKNSGFFFKAKIPSYFSNDKRERVEFNGTFILNV